MTDLIDYVIRGIPLGCVYSLVAIGLVLTYKTSGVFNLAFGAQAFVSAAVYYDVRARHDWPIVPAFVLAVVVVGPLIGLVLDRALYRHLRTAPALAKLVTSLGLAVALPEIVKLWFGRGSAFAPPTIWPNEFGVYSFGDYVLDGNQVATLISTAIAVLGLTLLFRSSSIGLRMRAVVESPRMTELAGINADHVSTFSWMLSSLFAGLAGVLLSPLFAEVAALNFTILLIAAIAAAAFARLTSIPLALVGGLLLGVAQGILTGYLPLDSILAQGLRPSLPFVALFLLLLFWPGLRQQREITDPLAGVDPPPPGLAALERAPLLTYVTWALGTALVLLGVYLALFVVNDFWLVISTRAVIFALVFLSITVITGMAGQISLCQATFAAVGAFATAQLADRLDVSPLLTMVIGAGLAAGVGALLAVPALRLGGIYLALATLAFAFMFDSVIVPQDWASGGQPPIQVPAPRIGPFDFANDQTVFVFSLLVLGVVGLLVILVRNGTTGRYLDALHGSEVAAASIGVDRAHFEIVAFALSAGIAGLGGGLLAIQETQANYQSSFTPIFGLFWIVIVVTLGARTVEGAVMAGLALAFVPELLKTLGVSPSYQFILFGLGALTYAKHPEGIVEFGKRQSLAFVQRHLRPPRAPTPAVTNAPRPAYEPSPLPERPSARDDGSPLLDASHISKRFAGIHALEDVTLSVGSGEAVGLIGPNGAGKTTFFNCLLGIVQSDSGSVVFDGSDVTHRPVYQRAHLGIGRTFQRIELFGGMTVRDHLLVAERARLGTGRLWKDVLNRSKPTAGEWERTERTLELLHLCDVADRPIESLSLGTGRLVELGRALMTEPLLLLLDEPSSGLDQQETAELVANLQEVQCKRGTAILLVEHDVKMVQSLATRLHVLDFGTMIAEGPTAEVLANEAVRKAYLGELV